MQFNEYYHFMAKWTFHKSDR